MSHKVLVLWLTVAVLLVTFVTPAPVAHRQVGQASTAWTTSESHELSASLAFSPSLVQPNGGCEDGGASGCPRPY